jgi:hypothetical protein
LFLVLMERGEVSVSDHAMVESNNLGIDKSMLYMYS